MLRSVSSSASRTNGAVLSLRQEMNRLFDYAFRGASALPSRGNAVFSPSIDVKETDKVVELQAELPGVDQKDVNVTYAGGVLTLRGEKKAQNEEAQSRYHFSERSYGSFVRLLAVGNIDARKIEATVDNGVLKIILPKVSAAASDTTRTEIKIGK